MEENTDWGTRRKGAFRDNLLATERLLGAGIAPRWQLFITKRSLRELNEWKKLLLDLRLVERCRDIGQKFEFFIAGMSPEGNGYELEEERLELEDLAKIPDWMIRGSRDGITLLGKPEAELYSELLATNSPPNMAVNVKALAVNENFDVYPNIAEPSEWWRLGNLKTDGVDHIIKTYRDETTRGMSANKTILISELIRRYGNPNSKKMYTRDNLICRLMHQWGMDDVKRR